MHGTSTIKYYVIIYTCIMIYGWFKRVLPWSKLLRYATGGYLDHAWLAVESMDKRGVYYILTP